MNRIHGRTLLLFFITAFALPAFSNTADRILGFEKAAHFHQQGKGSWYIQAGAFTRAANAVDYQNRLQKKLPFPVRLEKTQPFYRVIIGPLPSAIAVRKAATMALDSKAAVPKTTRQIRVKLVAIAPVALKNHQTTRASTLPVKGLPSRGILLAAEGAVYQSKNRQMTVDNGSDFPSPADRDIYTAQKANPGAAGLTLGWYWDRQTPWFPAWSLGLRYQYRFSNNHGQVIQYSTAKYTNYDYEWKTRSNILLAQGKLAIGRFSRVLPWFSAGAGLALNQSAGYSEAALAGVTSRTSPDFGNKTRSQFTYVLGTGLDYQISPNLLFSLGYEFQDLGKFQSGPGTAAWSSETLGQSGVHANALLFGVNYWLER